MFILERTVNECENLQGGGAHTPLPPDSVSPENCVNTVQVPKKRFDLLRLNVYLYNSTIRSNPFWSYTWIFIQPWFYEIFRRNASWKCYLWKRNCDFIIFLIILLGRLAVGPTQLKTLGTQWFSCRRKWRLRVKRRIS